MFEFSFTNCNKSIEKSERRRFTNLDYHVIHIRLKLLYWINQIWLTSVDKVYFIIQKFNL